MFVQSDVKGVPRLDVNLRAAVALHDAPTLGPLLGVVLLDVDLGPTPLVPRGRHLAELEGLARQNQHVTATDGRGVVLGSEEVQ